ncbi:MAG: M20/M25/M40 family metallo-hydrolase [Chloroflexi bacterium]|nr:M20/M25/M40 family metallo-hydrolase [Chloroflexota bacterium]
MKVAVIYNKQTIDTGDVINVFGPQTKEKYNPKTVEQVARALEQGGHNVKVIEGNINVGDELRHFMPRVIAGERHGMVFNMAYGIQGHSRYTHIPAMLEMLGVPYVGSGPQAHAIALDKVLAKIIFQQQGLPTPAFWTFSHPDEPMDSVQFPAIVKPRMESVSMGLRIVNNQAELQEAVRFIIEAFQQQALVEAFIAGREFAVGLLGNGQEVEVLPIVEIDLSGDPQGIQTEDDKLQKPREKICPAPVSDIEAKQMRDLARMTFDALGICDFARIDLRMDAEGNLYILELNSMASLGLGGSYYYAARNAGYTYDSLVNRMLDTAAVRYFGQDSFSQLDDDSTDIPAAPQPLRAKVRSYARSNLTTMTDYLYRMVSTNTYVYNIEGVNELGHWIAGRITALGFQKQVFPQNDVGNTLYFSNHEGPQNDILVLGHLDTPHNYQAYLPFREERGRFYGSGVAESKGGLAVILGALQALRFTRRIRRVRCGILLTTDDTLGGRYSKQLVAELATRSKYVVGTKYSDLGGGLITSCSGSASFQFELTNSKGITDQLPSDVIKIICQKILAWQKLADKHPGLTVRASRLEAKTSVGVAPDYASGSLMIHFNTAASGNDLEKQIRDIARKNLEPGCQLRIRRNFHRPAVGETEGNRAFFKEVVEIAQRLEINTEAQHRNSSSDICHVPVHVPVLEGFGPLGSDIRTSREYILRDSLPDRSALLAMVIRLSAEDFK